MITNLLGFSLKSYERTIFFKYYFFETLSVTVINSSIFDQGFQLSMKIQNCHIWPEEIHEFHSITSWHQTNRVHIYNGLMWSLRRRNMDRSKYNCQRRPISYHDNGLFISWNWCIWSPVHLILTRCDVICHKGEACDMAVLWEKFGRKSTSCFGPESWPPESYEHQILRLFLLGLCNVENLYG